MKACPQAVSVSSLKISKITRQRAYNTRLWLCWFRGKICGPLTCVRKKVSRRPRGGLWSFPCCEFVGVDCPRMIAPYLRSFISGNANPLFSHGDFPVGKRDRRVQVSFAQALSANNNNQKQQRSKEKGIGPCSIPCARQEHSSKAIG